MNFPRLLLLASFLTFVFILIACALVQSVSKNNRPLVYPGIWVPDNDDGTYLNPIIYADYSDPDAIMVGNDFYLISSSFNCVPGLPILHSKDLINWKIIGHAVQSLKPKNLFEKPQHGKGVWAPSIRYHENKFYIYYGDPDYGIYVVTAKNPSGPWDEPLLIKEAKGWIDPCPLWDDDGNVYLVHAWAKSRCGFNSILTLNKMNHEGTKILDSGVTIFDGHKNHPTIEGPKLYKRNGFYYIFAPAGGVKTGWQTVLRSKNILGPYDDKIAMDQGSTLVNGPHQGALVELNSGESWFIHFQDKEAYGRIVHLQPVKWFNDWPIIGIDLNGDGRGEPVDKFKKPDVGESFPVSAPKTSDEFDSYKIGEQWQWQANPESTWSSLSANAGYLRLFVISESDYKMNLWNHPNLLLQKFPASQFIITTKFECNLNHDGEKAGLVVMGTDYSYISIRKENEKLILSQSVCLNADREGTEIELNQIMLSSMTIYLRLTVANDAMCKFSYSEDNIKFTDIENVFPAKPGKWIGAKVGLFCIGNNSIIGTGFVDVDWFRVHKF
jgi:beta-xylosidase